MRLLQLLQDCMRACTDRTRCELAHMIALLLNNFVLTVLCVMTGNLLERRCW